MPKRFISNKIAKAPRFDNLRPASIGSSLAKRANRSSDTKHEILLRQELWRLGLRFRKNVSTLPGKPDIVFAKSRVVVFCDGDFWHGNHWRSLKIKLQMGSNSSYWVAKIERNRKKDRQIAKRLVNDGWYVLRFWESEISKYSSTVAQKIATIVEARSNQEIEQRYLV